MITCDPNAESNTPSSSRKLAVQPRMPQDRELDAKQKTWKITSTLQQWLPRNFHELLYGVLTLVCAVEALRTGSVPLQLMGLWTAAAAQIGVPTASHAFTTIVERIAPPKSITKKRTTTKENEV